MLPNDKFEEVEKSNNKTIIFSVLITAIIFSALSFFWQKNDSDSNTEIDQLSSQVQTLSAQLATLQASLTASDKTDDDNKDIPVKNEEQSEPNRDYVEPVNLMPEPKGAFAYKYGINANDVSINVSESTATHTRGTVSMNGGQSRIFLAARGNGSYTIVYDGNGTILCSVLTQYNFPVHMTYDCAQ